MTEEDFKLNLKACCTDAMTAGIPPEVVVRILNQFSSDMTWATAAIELFYKKKKEELLDIEYET